MMSVRRKCILRGLIGAPCGIALGQLITLAISFIGGDGRYYSCVPELAAQMGGETCAVALQSALCALLGFASAAASVCFEMERWSIARATGTHFLIMSLSMLPIAYFTRWMEHTPLGVATYFGVFLGMYALIWAVMYISVGVKVRRINARLNARPDR